MTDILIIEDTAELAELLADFLGKEGFTVEKAYTGEAGLKYLQENEVGIVLLDIMLPGIDGFAVCEHIRRQLNVPLFVMSAKTDRESQLNGLTLGADDYVEKPFDIDVLIAKLKAVYRRYYESDNESQVLQCGRLRLDEARHEASVGGSILNLTIKEYELLKLLMENKEKTLSKEVIFNKVWGIDSFSEPSTLTVHIKWLRQKIEKDAKNPEYIKTVWGIGYRLTGEADGQ